MERVAAYRNTNLKNFRLTDQIMSNFEYARQLQEEDTEMGTPPNDNKKDDMLCLRLCPWSSTQGKHPCIL